MQSVVGEYYRTRTWCELKFVCFSEFTKANVVVAPALDNLTRRFSIGLVFPHALLLESRSCMKLRLQHTVDPQKFSLKDSRLVHKGRM